MITALGSSHVVSFADAGIAPATSRSVLAIDIGKSTVSVLVNGESAPRHAESGKKLTPQRMVAAVRELAEGWTYDSVSIGYPGRVGDGGPVSEPHNLGPGWVGFDFASAFGCPVRVANDAAMQAMGSYAGGRMLFVALGSGVGAALISENTLVTLELARLSFGPGLTVGQVLSRAGMKKSGKSAWRAAVDEVLTGFKSAFHADYVVVSGGNSHNVKKLPAGCRRGNDLTSFRGGYSLWTLEDVRTLVAEGQSVPPAPTPSTDWRVL